MLDFSLTEEQKLIRQTAQDFIARECPLSAIREIEDSHQDFPRALYAKMAALGWLGFLLPEEHGGSGLDWASTCVLYEEMGRGLVPSPHWSSVILSGQAILAFGSEEQKERLLPALTRGETLVALALAEPEYRSDLTALKTAASPSDGGYRLDGVKLMVRGGHYADCLIVVARVEPAPAGAVTLFLIDRGRPGVSTAPMQTLGGERVAEVVLQDVPVSEGDILGDLHGAAGITEVLDRAGLLLAAESVGGAKASLDLAVEYATFRVAFGRPIGSFQAMQHKLANVALAIECARVATYYAAWLTDQGREATAERAMAQLEGGEAYRLATAEATQVHGGYGVMKETDISLFFRRAKALQQAIGPAEALRERMLTSLQA